MKTNYIQKRLYLVKKWIWRIFSKTCEKNTSFFLCTFHNVEKWKIYSHWENISSNQLFIDFFSKNVAFTKILPKKREIKFPYIISTLESCFHRKFREIEECYLLDIMLVSRKIFENTTLNNFFWSCFHRKFREIA